MHLEFSIRAKEGRLHGTEPSVLQDGDDEANSDGWWAVGVTWGDPDLMSVHLPFVLIVTFLG